jgi:glucose-6-phosphate-specific signal transduction histidine kinase
MSWRPLFAEMTLALLVCMVSYHYVWQYAWISLLFVAVVLFLFRKIYGEVVEQSLLMVEHIMSY